MQVIMALLSFPPVRTVHTRTGNAAVSISLTEADHEFRHIKHGKHYSETLKALNNAKQYI